MCSMCAPAAGGKVEADDNVKSLLATANKLKAEGNEAFKAGDYGKAVTIYVNAIDRLTSTAAKKALRWESEHAESRSVLGDSNREAVLEQDTALPLLVTLHTNRAASHVKLEQWEAAVASASRALELDCSSTKARFRRGVACSHLGRMEDAKVDLTAVAKAEPKNREARTVLEVVLAALEERKGAERAMFSRAFAGPSLYAEEEARAARAAHKAAEAKAMEEARLLREWRVECARLREGGPHNATAALLSEAAEGGDEEALLALDRMALVSLEDFGKRQAEDRARAKRWQEEAEAARRRAGREAREARAALDVGGKGDEGDEDGDLGELSKGYKTRADGSKTTYFDRPVDEKIRALLDAQKAPRRIESVPPAAGPAPGTAAATTPREGGGGSSGGSVWNAAGTYEERDCSSWALAALKPRLAAVRTGTCTVREVAVLEGTAQVISARGRTKRLFDFRFELRWEGRWEAMGVAEVGIEHGAATGAECRGVLVYSDVSPAVSGAAPFAYELSEQFEASPPADIHERVAADVLELKRQVQIALHAFTADFGQK